MLYNLVIKKGMHGLTDESRGLRQKSNLIIVYNYMTSYGKDVRSSDWKLKPDEDGR